MTCTGAIPALQVNFTWSPDFINGSRSLEVMEAV